LNHIFGISDQYRYKQIKSGKKFRTEHFVFMGTVFNQLMLMSMTFLTHTAIYLLTTYAHCQILLT